MDVEHIDMTTTSQHADEPGTAVAMAETVDGMWLFHRLKIIDYIYPKFSYLEPLHLSSASD